jgi:CrcB protein
MLPVIYIGIGGFIGAVSRYLLVRYFLGLFPSFPVGTLAVNVLGSFVLGIIVYAISPGKLSPEMRDMIIIGILGGFTTMSAFAYDSFRFLELNQLPLFILNIILNVVLCITAVYAGKVLGLLFIK